EAEPTRDIGHRTQARSAQLGGGYLCAQRADARAVERSDRDRESGDDRAAAKRAARAREGAARGSCAVSARRGARLRGARAAERVPRLDGGGAVEDVAGACALRDRLAPGVERRGHGLVVVRCGELAGGAAGQASHDAYAQPLERWQREVAVEIVAMRRVDV